MALTHQSSSASRSGRLDRLLQHELPLLLHQSLGLIGQQRKQPRELNLKPDVVLGDINSAGRVLAEHACAKIQVVADHWFLNTRKLPPLDWASLKLACKRRTASALPSWCGRVTTMGCDITICLNRLEPQSVPDIGRPREA